MGYLIVAAVLLIYLVLVWFLGSIVNPPGAGIWILRGGLWFIGLVGTAFSFWWVYRRRKEKEAEEGGAEVPSGAIGELDLLVRDAVRRLKSSSLGRGASLGNLPLIFLMGDSGSAKTTTIIHSALDPELLAGQVYQDSNVLPTRIANFWYTRQAVFVDAAGGIFSQPDAWKRLIKLVQPGRVASAGKKQQAARAAIVCVDCESFLRPGASEATLSTARRLGARLIEISQTLGISFPIYVLFTRADRIGARADGGSLFLDYVAGLTRDEVSQVLGATLPVRSMQATGVYAEEETARLSKAFDELFYSLAEKRIDLLALTGQTEKAPGVYEFPRELRKLRKPLVQFLVDLARPSQLTVNPFLRGFYFCGVRPSVIDDVAALPEEPAPDAGFNPNATVVFGSAGMRAPQAQAPRIPSSRKVPEWVFLSHLFNEVILKDRVALSASGFSSRVSLLRRVAFATLGAIALIFAIGFLVSFIGNLSLERDVRQAAEDVRAIPPSPMQTAGQLPNVDALQRLDRLREQLETVGDYNRNGVPLHLRWWLYSGEEIYSPARQIYFDHFRDLLFGETEDRLRNILLASKAKPAENDSYQIPYNDLRAFLITAGYWKYSTQDFLSPVLMKHWLENRTTAPDDTVSQLVRNQFDFYSTELAFDDPYSLKADPLAVDRARGYLQGFTGIERYYFPLLEKAHTATNSDLHFRSVFPNSVGVVEVQPDLIKAAFTKEGFDAIETALSQPGNQMSEEWVLGKTIVAELDPTSLRQKLQDRYETEFIQQWHDFLDHSHAHVSQSSPGEAASKLETLTSASSPLLELIWFISHNTKVADPNISDVFAPVQAVVPPGPDKGFPKEYKGGGNAPYMEALSKLREDLSALAKSTGTPDPSAAIKSGEAAKTAADTLAGNKVDEKYHIPDSLDRLLKEPIGDAEIAAGGSGKAPLNAGGRSFCGQLEAAERNFPFNPKGPDLPIDQLNSLLAPGTGALSGLGAKLTQYVTKQGSTYFPNDSGNIKISPQFLYFFNHASALSDALYPGGSTTPKVTYALKQVSTNIDGLSLKIGADSLAGTGQQKSFTWTGAPEDILATAKDIPVGAPYSGPWAIFHFMVDGHPVGRGSGTYELLFTEQSNGKDIIINGQKQSFTYNLQFASGNPWAAFSGLGCVSSVAH
jgi:type VI secretion system protein ImpL